MAQITAEQIAAEGKEIAERIMGGDIEAINTPTLYETACRLLENYNGHNPFLTSLWARYRQGGFKTPITDKQAATVLNIFLERFEYVQLDSMAHWR